MLSIPNVRQEGIYFDSDVPASFAMIFLRIDNKTEVAKIGVQLSHLWKTLQNLKKGIVEELPGLSRNLSSGNLSILIGYGTNLFDIQNISRARPLNFPSSNIFSPPSPGGGGPIIQGTNLMYDKNIVQNHAGEDEIVLQFVADTQLAVNRAIVETFKNLCGTTTKNENSITATKFYTGFNRPDKRSWLGFLDGVSNMETEERKNAIYINPDQVTEADNWIVSGTYLTFLRIVINLNAWWAVSRAEQEIMIGRDKLSGCPLIGVDNLGNPIKDKRCPAPGTTDITEKGNEIFREHPPYGRQANLPKGVADDLLKYSHIGSVRKATSIPTRKIESYRIFRQGFEFLQPNESTVGYEAGLNFVSFQNDPKRFVGNLSSAMVNVYQFFSVHGAGIFFVPPLNKGEIYPGSSIFQNGDGKIRRGSNLPAGYQAARVSK